MEIRCKWRSPISENFSRKKQ